jgi:uncharacterized membrane protein YbhN (UPF0104 family)
MTTDQSLQTSRRSLRHLLAAIMKKEPGQLPTVRWFRLFAKNARLFVTIGILSWLAWRTDWHRVGHAFQNLRLELWLAAFSLCVLMQVISGWRWQLLARPLGFHGRVRDYTSYYFIGMYFNLLLPTSVGGDVVRAWFLDHRKGRRLAALVSVLVDRASGLLVLLLVACTAVIVCPISLETWVIVSVWGMTACAGLALVLLPVVVRKLGRWNRFRRLVEGAQYYLQHPRLLLVTAGLSLGVQAANVVMVCLLGWAINAQVPAIYYWVFVPMICLLTLLPISLNGMGIREGGTVLLLAPVGVEESIALCLAILWFSILTATSLCGGAVYFLGWFPPPQVDAQRPMFQNENSC